MATSQLLLPTGREEAWRFTPLARVIGVLDGSIASGTPLVRNLSHDPSVTVSSLSGDDAGAIVEPSDFAAALAIEKSAETLLVQIDRKSTRLNSSHT